nr:uncharacterized protein LOC111426900 isoform X1 [Onthophagus taurus]
MVFVRQCMKKDKVRSARRNYKKIGESGFPPGVTVDELYRYRKKKQKDAIQLEDNLYFGEGSYKSIVSEYTRSFHNLFLQELKLPKLTTSDVAFRKTWRPDYARYESNYFLKKSLSKGRKSVFDETMDLNEEFDKSLRYSTEIRSKYINHDGFIKQNLIKPLENLKIEGDLLTSTEKAEKFIEYLLFKRQHLLKKPTTLKLEGEMEKNTENREKFVMHDYQERPPLCKKSTNLHLEGDRIISTENHDKFLPFKVEKRQPLLKMSTNLHLEGDLDLHPEYRDVFVEHKVQKQTPLLPAHNIKIDGTYDINAETKSKESHHPLIPFLRGGDRKFILGDDKDIKYPEYKEKFVLHPKSERPPAYHPSSHLKQRGAMEGMTETREEFVEKRSPRTERRRRSTHLKLEGKRAMTPEYKNAYIDFYETGRRSPVKRIHGRTGNLKTDGEMDINPEYSSSFVNFPRERPNVKRPECHLKNSGEMHHLTEKEAVYVQHKDFHKSELIKHEPELKLEGRFECQPEYRKAYRDYLIRERVQRKPRPIDNLIISKKKEDEKKPIEDTLNKPHKSKRDSKSSDSKSYIPVSVKKPAATSSSSDDRKRSSASTMSSITSKLNLKSSKLPLPKPKLVVPKSSTNSSSSRLSRSLSPTTRKPTNLRRKSSTKLVKSKSSQRMVSPEVVHRSRVGSRFSSPVRVEDLAYQPITSPLPWIIRDVSPDKRLWHDRKSKNKAFVVLDRQVHNNSCCCTGGEGLYKEQRWMPSWYTPT